MTTATHPAASLEFLSRLHDGELSAQERSEFEAHLAECAECREAVAAYERSLRAFRAAPEAPVPYDLSARILRKIRAQSPSRRPFGVMFGIDIRWAGVFMAALLVAIIAPALLERRPVRPVSPPAEPETLRAYVVDAPADKRDADAVADAAKPKKSTVEPPRAEPPAASESKLRQRVEPRFNDRVASIAEPADTLAAAPPQSAAAPEREQAQPAEGMRNAAPAPPAAAKRSAAATETVGGEAGALAKEEAPAQELRFDVHSLDADGRAPAIVQVPAAERLQPLRGREFVVLVQADGSVSAVLPSSRQHEADRRQKDSAAADTQASDAALFELRFQATGQPRRLLIRVR